MGVSIVQMGQLRPREAARPRPRRHQALPGKPHCLRAGAQAQAHGGAVGALLGRGPCWGQKRGLGGRREPVPGWRAPPAALPAPPGPGGRRAAPGTRGRSARPPCGGAASPRVAAAGPCSGEAGRWAALTAVWRAAPGPPFYLIFFYHLAINLIF